MLWQVLLQFPFDSFSLFNEISTTEQV
uniref:Uncharacterized protein n=1 Tax=Rhizophora mucronata TaxID=61149 RepID=A0A2P2N3F5_RHIMU